MYIIFIILKLYIYINSVYPGWVCMCLVLCGHVTICYFCSLGEGSTASSCSLPAASRAQCEASTFSSADVLDETTRRTAWICLAHCGHTQVAQGAGCRQSYSLATAQSDQTKTEPGYVQGNLEKSCRKTKVDELSIAIAWVCLSMSQLTWCEETLWRQPPIVGSSGSRVFHDRGWCMLRSWLAQSWRRLCGRFSLTGSRCSSQWAVHHSMKSRTRTSLREDMADLYDDFAIGWNELFDEESASMYKKMLSTVLTMYCLESKKNQKQCSFYPS